MKPIWQLPTNILTRLRMVSENKKQENDVRHMFTLIFSDIGRAYIVIKCHATLGWETLYYLCNLSNIS